MPCIQSLALAGGEHPDCGSRLRAVSCLPSRPHGMVCQLDRVGRWDGDGGYAAASPMGDLAWADGQSGDHRRGNDNLTVNRGTLPMRHSLPDRCPPCDPRGNATQCWALAVVKHSNDSTSGENLMAMLTVRNLEADRIRRLRICAAEHGRSAEASTGKFRVRLSPTPRPGPPSQRRVRSACAHCVARTRPDDGHRHSRLGRPEMGLRRGRSRYRLGADAR